MPSKTVFTFAGALFSNMGYKNIFRDDDDKDYNYDCRKKTQSAICTMQN